MVPTIFREEGFRFYFSRERSDDFSRHVVWELREALDALESLIRDMEANPDYGNPELTVNLSHLYWHINTAWNARFVAPERTATCSHEDFDDWRQYPDGLEMI